MVVAFSGARVWFGGLCLVAMAGCGGRTSTFTPEDDPSFGSSMPAGGGAGVSGSSSSGTAPQPTPSAGASSIPAGGATSTGTGVAGGATTGGSSGIAGAPSSGTGGSAGTTGSAAAATCANFCAQAAVNCSNTFGGYSDCVSSCTNQLGASALCLQLGQAVINCFLPLIEGGGPQCRAIETYSPLRCSQQLDQFQQRCSDSPTPTPVPVPPPLPEPAANCSSAGSSSGVTCDLTSKCVDGTYYMVNCKQGSPTESFCTCQTGNSSGASAGGGFTLNESVAFACYDAVSACGGPIPSTLPPPR